MKKVIFKSLFTSILLVLGLSVGVKQTTHEVVEAAEGDLLAEFNSDTLVTDSRYAEYSDNNWILTMGGNNVSIGVNSGNKSKAKLGSYSNIAAGVYGENDTVISAVIAKAPLSKVTKINISASNVTQDNVTVTLTKSSDYVGYELIEQKEMNKNTTKIEFNLTYSSDNYYYAIIFHNATNFRLDNCLIDFIEGADLSISYTATLHYNDGKTEDGSITSVEGKFTAPETPTRTGYVFDGWYTDATFENLFDFENTFATENIDLYAKWVDERDTYLQTTSFALGFDYAFSGGNEVTSLEQLISGNTYYLCASLDSTNVATNTLDSGKLTTVNSLSEGNVYKFVNNGSTWDIIDPLTNNYLLYAGSGTDLKLENTPTDSWTIEYLDGEFSIKSNLAPSREILYRSGTFNVFGGYASSNISNSEYSRIKLFSDASYSFSNYALRFGTEITTENYAKLGEVVDYGVLVAPTASLEGSTFKEWYGLSNGLEELVNTLDALNITNAEKQTTETGYSFGGLLKNIPETQIHTSVSAACYVVNAAGEVFFAEQKDMSIVGAATYYAEHAAELGLNETETTLVNVLKGM